VKSTSLPSVAAPTVMGLAGTGLPHQADAAGCDLLLQGEDLASVDGIGA
jgi:hypothetical protein